MRITGGIATCLTVTWALAAAAQDDFRAVEQAITRTEEALQAEPERADLLYSLSHLYEQAGRWEQAREIAEQVLGRGETYDARLRLGWLNLRLQDHAAAVRHYERAAVLAPESEDAWLGLQRARMGLADWPAAEAAGARVLAANPRNYWALVRQGYVEFQQRNYDVAERLYQRALTERPEDGESLLGLGFVMRRRGRSAEAVSFCRRAEKIVGADPRVAECLAGEIPPGAQYAFAAALSGSYFKYSDAWNLDDLKSGTLSAGLSFPWGLGLWAGATWSGSVQNYEVDNFAQLSPVLGLSYRRAGWAAGLSGAMLFNNDTKTDQAKAAMASAGYDGAFAGGGASLAASFYDWGRVWQTFPQFRVHLGERAHFGTGPQLILVYRADVDAPETHWSGQLDFSCHVWSIWSAWLTGYYGPRRYAVAAEGLSIWNNDDRFIGGYRLGHRFAVWRHLALTVEFRHDWGDEQSGRPHDFSLYGLTLGTAFTF